MLDKRYDFTALEAHFSAQWEETGCFMPAMDGRAPFAIMMPPPNVTGTLHIGHALDNTLPDILVRRARMQGKDALYQPGTDHASIAVHVVLERQWAKEGKSRFDFGRETFLEKAWDWKDHSAGLITRQLRRLGISCDWSNERFTMDPAYTIAVNKVFVELYNRGLIYRGQRLVNWDPRMQTAVSDLEVKHKEVDGHLWHVRYRFAGEFSYKGKDGIEIATTRPETILADGAIAIHPQDPRAKDLVGKKVIVPVVEREIFIIADEMVDPEFGSGLVKITAAHDFNDFECYKRHKDEVEIPLINLMTPDARMNGNCPPAYVGLDRFEARKKIVADLEEMGLLIKAEPHKHNIGHAERDDTILEPYLTWQWYVKGEPLAAKCLKAAEDGEVKFVNERDAKVYRHWLENIQDWCISRQLWWGHRIPAWYRDVDGQAEPELYVGEDAPQGEGWRQEDDILDTWFSSALWPFVTQGWPQESLRLTTFYPGAVIMSGRDILFFWLIRMMMMSLEINDKVPFGTIYTHGMILDAHGQKMSKSKGNVVDPMELVERYGADAMRFTMAGIASSEDMRFSEDKVEQSRNFCTKLWNAARFLNMQDVRHTHQDEQAFNPSTLKHPANIWMVGQLRTLFTKLDRHLDAYEFNQATHELYHFTWGVFCDWYLEMTKPLLAGDEATAKETRATIGWAFEKLLIGLHPFIPFITEQLWEHHILAENEFLMLRRWPAYQTWPDGSEVAAEMDKLLDIISALRQARTLHKLPPKTAVNVEVRGLDEMALSRLKEHLSIFTAVAGVESLSPRAEPAGTGEASVVVDGVEYIMPLKGLINVEAERSRLEKEMDKQQQEMAKLDALLSDKGFMSRAPKDKIEQNQARKQDIVENISKIKDMLAGPYAQV